MPAAPERKKGERTTGSPVDTNPDTDLVDEVIEGLFRRSLQLESTHRWALNNLGLHLHARNRDDEVRGLRDTPMFSPGTISVGLTTRRWLRMKLNAGILQ